MPDVTTYTVLPDWFTAEVAAAQAELAEVAPRVLALFDRYQGIVSTFNELVPKAAPNGGDEVWSVPWTDCGGRHLQHSLVDLVSDLNGELGTPL